MTTTIDPQTIYGTQLIGADGAKLGKVEEIYLDEKTHRLEWAEVKTGMLGNKVSLVPLATAERTREGLRIPFDKDQVKSAPAHDSGQTLSQDEEIRLFRHYGVPYGGETVTAEAGRSAVASESRDGSRTRRRTDDAMTRSEEELSVGTRPQEQGRARLRKYVVTENVTRKVPVSHEEVRVEREPITDANADAAMSGPPISEGDHEVVLHEEQPFVEKRTVPKERVRLDKETVTKETPVEAEAQKERIDVEGAEGHRRRR